MYRSRSFLNLYVISQPSAGQAEMDSVEKILCFRQVLYTEVPYQKKWHVEKQQANLNLTLMIELNSTL